MLGRVFLPLAAPALVMVMMVGLVATAGEPQELAVAAAAVATPEVSATAELVALSQEAMPSAAPQAEPVPPADFWSLLFVFALATFIGLGVIRRVSRLLHTPLMSITNAISAIAVVGSIIVTGSEYPTHIRILGAIALFASMTNIVSGFLITDRMLKMFKTGEGAKK